MALSNGRRSRSATYDDEDFSRESTPLSTAPNDRKRMRPGSGGGSTSPMLALQVPARQQAAAHTGDGNGAILRRKHQPGAIVRVKLTNFVTYTSAEFFPGPNLNMVIGPNGTGKSTLVCAICLGLGWGPSLLGRAKDPSEFVKHGSKEAMVEIELQRAESGENKSKRNPIIRRRIVKDGNKSSFWINDNAATNKAVHELVTRFNIQVDNLCQFLPQDRVVEFAQMTPVQMLETTLQAAAEPEVLEHHEHLKALRQAQQDFMYNSKGDRETLDNLQKRQEAQRLEVERLKERMETQKQIGHLQKCIVAAQYMETRRRVNDLKGIRDKLQEETAQLEEESEPALRKVTEKQQYAAEAKRNRDHHASEVKRADNECKRIDREINIFNETVKECESRLRAEREGAKKDKQSLGQFQGDLQRLKGRKEAEPEPFDSRAMNEQIQQHAHRARDLEQRIEGLSTELGSEANRGRTLREDRKKKERNLEDLSTQQGQQEARLENLSRDTHRAWQWIKENQSKFQKEVFGPPAVTCTVRDPAMASSIESLMQVNDFKIITTQCTADFRLLQEELTRRQRLHDISLRTCSIQDISSFRKPMGDAQLQSLGLQHWAIDCLEGPPTVLAMLCQERSLNSVGISSRDVSSEQHDRIAASAIRSYVGGNKSVRFTRRAEYGDAGVSARTSDVKPARVWTNQPVDAGRKQELNRQIKHINIEVQEVKENCEKLKQEIYGLQVEREREKEAERQIRDEKDAKQKALAEWKGLDAKIEQMQSRIGNVETRLANFRDRVKQLTNEKDDAMFGKAEAVFRYCEAAHTLRDFSTKLLEAEVVNIEAQSDCQNLQEINKHIQQALQEKKKELEESIRNFRECHRLGKEQYAKTEALAREADELEKNGDNSLNQLLGELRQDKNITERGIQDRIESLQSRLDLVAGGLADANTIREFEERAKKIEKLQSRVDTFNANLEESMEAINNIRSVFERHLHPIIEQIDRAFGESFARIGCAGQVAVHKASSEDPADCTEAMGGTDNGLDFAHWAIHISVKFRESEPLSLLDSHRQSGGERAVSTIFYLMALQSLSKSPFRVVDEINQGMDPRNERMVHGRMVDIAVANEKLVAEGKASGSQYFLITPKLLSGLRYERGMTVLCIVSGENMPSATDYKMRNENGQEYVEKGKKIDFTAFARRARELGLGQYAGNFGSGRRIDSGVGMRRSVPVYA